MTSDSPSPRSNPVDQQFAEYGACVTAATSLFNSDMLDASEASDQVDNLNPDTPLPQPDPWETSDPPHPIDTSGWGPVLTGWWVMHKYNNALQACGSTYKLAALHP